MKRLSKTHRVVFLVDDEEFARIEDKAIKSGTGISEMVRSLVLDTPHSESGLTHLSTFIATEAYESLMRQSQGEGVSVMFFLSRIILSHGRAGRPRKASPAEAQHSATQEVAPGYFKTHTPSSDPKEHDLEVSFGGEPSVKAPCEYCDPANVWVQPKWVKGDTSCVCGGTGISTGKHIDDPTDEPS